MKIYKEPAVPPARLFHGTAPESAERILDQGLKPMNRQYVHLSADVETAREVGRRKSRQPVVLSIDAGLAYQEGVHFYHGNQMVWLTDHVPPRYINRHRNINV